MEKKELKKEIESPFVEGAKAHLRWEEKQHFFRKEPFVINEAYYKCEKTFQEFTTNELDEYSINQVFNQYMEKYGLQRNADGEIPHPPYDSEGRPVTITFRKP